MKCLDNMENFTDVTIGNKFVKFWSGLDDKINREVQISNSVGNTVYDITWDDIEIQLLRPLKRGLDKNGN